jgi:hypothetical protein
MNLDESYETGSTPLRHLQGAETAHGLGVAPRGHGAPVLSCANVDTCGVGVADLEGFSEDG